MSRVYVLVLGLALVWSTSWPMTRAIVSEVPPATLVLARLAIAAIVLMVYLHASGQRLPRWGRIWAQFALIAFISNALPFTAVAWAQRTVPSGLAAVLAGTMPVWTVLVSALFAQGDRASERLNLLKLAGLACGIAGIVVLVGPDSLTLGGGLLLGQLALIGAAMTWSVGTVYMSFVRGVTTDQAATMSMLLSSLMMLPVSLLLEQPWTLSPSASTWAMMLAIGLLSTALGTILVFTILRRGGPTVFAMVLYINPAFAVVWGVLFHGETLQLHHFGAFALIGGALWLIGRGQQRAARRAGLALDRG